MYVYSHHKKKYMVYLKFVQNYGRHSCQLPVSEAYVYVRSHGITSKELIHLAYCDDVAEANWYAAIYHYIHTRSKRLCLYDRCIHEKKMRERWSVFKKHFHYAEPSVPPLPPITP